MPEPRPDVDPDGDPIDTHTIWLPFDNGEVAITADLTKWNAAMRPAHPTGDPDA